MLVGVNSRSPLLAFVLLSVRIVMAGLVPAIHVSPSGTRNVDAQDKPGHDDLCRYALAIANRLGEVPEISYSDCFHKKLRVRME
jgi:hypothetical protein